MEKNNHNFLINCFSETKIEDSYSNIVKEILLNLDIDNKINNIFDKDKKYAEMSENDFKKKYLDNYLYTNEIIKNKKRFKGYYLLLVLQTLKNLDINFFLGYFKFIKSYNKKNILFDNDFDIINLIKNENIPFAIKSLLLNFLFILALVPKK